MQVVFCVTYNISNRIDLWPCIEYIELLRVLVSFKNTLKVHIKTIHPKNIIENHMIIQPLHNVYTSNYTSISKKLRIFNKSRDDSRPIKQY